MRSYILYFSSVATYTNFFSNYSVALCSYYIYLVYVATNSCSYLLVVVVVVVVVVPTNPPPQTAVGEYGYHAAVSEYVNYRWWVRVPQLENLKGELLAL